MSTTKAPAPMKLHLLPDHVERLQFPITSKKRTEKLKDVIASRQGFLCEAQNTIAFPTGIESEGKTYKLSFELPDAFEIAATYNRDGELNALTIIQGAEQMTFTREGGKPSRFTMQGDGVGDLVKKGRMDTLKTLLGHDEPAKRARLAADSGADPEEGGVASLTAFCLE
jgi:hypothetical protein